MRAVRSAALLAALATALAVQPRAAAAQMRLMDEGTFSLFVGGERVGREDFSIRGSAGGGAIRFIAQGNVLLGESRVAVRLSTDSAGSPLLFTLEETRAGKLVEAVSGEARRDLWSGRALRPTGESAREFRVPAGSLASEATVIHHLWFLLRFGEGRDAMVVHPRSFTTEQVGIEDAGPDRVSLGLREFVARKWLIRPSSGVAAREAWTDTEGRLLRVRIPEANLEAVRDEAPAETLVTPPAYDSMEPFLQDSV